VKDLISKDAKQPQQTEADARTEVDAAQDALAEAMLFGPAQKQAAHGPARIILGLDCTSSMGEYVAERKITAQAAETLAQSLFAGHSGLQVQLAYFRGDDGSAKRPRQFRVSNEWYTEPTELARAITAIEHWPGWTQHCRLLRVDASPIERTAAPDHALEPGDDLDTEAAQAARVDAGGFKGHRLAAAMACAPRRRRKRSPGPEHHLPDRGKPHQWFAHRREEIPDERNRFSPLQFVRQCPSKTLHDVLCRLGKSFY
jgi:hypothetical protein